MLLDPSPDQEFLRETTDKFLSKEATVARLRSLRDDPAGFDRGFWRTGAELGWTSLLVSEASGGGSVSGRPLLDLAVLAHEFGRHGSPGPLLPANVAAAALSDQPGDVARSVLEAVLAGEVITTWAYEESGAFGRVTLDMRVEGGDVVISGRKRPVESAGQADWLLVTGRTGEGLTQALVPAGAEGLSVSPLKTVDLTRRFATATFDEVRVPVANVVGEIGHADRAVARQLDQALVIQGAESVGAMQVGFDMTVEWSFDRFSFGRPLASYQALKHRFADMKSWLEGSHAITDAAAEAVDADQADGSTLASAAKAFVGQYGAELLQDCVQMHGGIGVTFDHDLHIYLRRVTLNRMLLGTPADHRLRLGDEALDQEGPA
jgi:alkylation response protein AidB-like acyl-CoA dehydrogenase